MYVQKRTRENLPNITHKTLVIIKRIWYNRFCYKHAEVAQSVEQLIRNQQVAGSIPVFSTNQNVAILMVVAFFLFLRIFRKINIKSYIFTSTANKLITKHAVPNFILLQKIYCFYQLKWLIYYIESIGGFKVSMMESQNKLIIIISTILF